MSKATEQHDSPETPVHRRSIDEMRITEVETWIAGARERRLKQAQVYERGVAAKKQAKDAVSVEKLDKYLDKLQKAGAAIDKKLDGMTELVARVRLLTLEVENE